MEGYRKIIKCRVPWPANFTNLAKDFMDRLIVVDPARRLGCLKNGPAGVKEHAWFGGLDWKVGDTAAATKAKPNLRPPLPAPVVCALAAAQALESKSITAPHVPKIKSQLDDSNFDEYEDEGIQNYPDSDFSKDMFIDFAETWVGK